MAETISMQQHSVNTAQWKRFTHRRRPSSSLSAICWWLTSKK